MRFAFTDEQILFRKNVRETLARTCPPSRVREAWTSETGRSRERWRALAELGLVSALVDEAHGGLGMNELDLVLALEECGRAALPEPVAETAAIVVPLLRDLPSAASATWLERIARGDTVATIGLDSENVGRNPVSAGSSQASFARDLATPEGRREAFCRPSDPFVADAHFADVLILQRGDALYAVERGAVRLEAQRSVDGARRLFRVAWALPAAVCLATGDSAQRAIASANERAAVAFAAELLGLARHLVDTTVAYAKMRTQFGQPIGSFQAVKHALADAHLAVELTAPVVHRAAHSLAHLPAGSSDRAVHASMAKARASEAALLAARTALQCHGAIGYSFEHDLHLWMKRVWALAAAWGDAAHHHARIGAKIFGGA